MTEETAQASRASAPSEDVKIREPDANGAATSSTLRRLVGYMVTPSTRGRMILAVAARFVAIVGLVSLPFIVGQGMDVLAAGGPMDELTTWVSWGLVAVAVYVLTGYVADRTFASLATGGLRRLQVGLFEHIQSLSMGFFYRTPVGQLLSRVNNDAEVVAQFYEIAVSQLISATFTIVLLVGVMLLINVPLTIVALLVVPIMLAIMLAIMRVSGPAFAKLQEELGDTSGHQEESLAGYKVLIGSRRRAWASEVNTANAGRVFNVGARAYFIALIQTPLSQILVSLQTVLVFVVGTIMVIEGDATLGTVVAFTGYVTLLASPISQISNLLSTTLNAAAGGSRIFDILDTDPTVLDATDAKDYEFKGGHVEFKEVDFSYVKGQSILRKNTFEVQAGEHIGICGPTGAGKSTIINILTRYYDIDDGTILIDGQDIKKLTRSSLRKHVGVVLQEAFLFSDTLMNNLKYAREGATDEECIEAAKQANAHEFIERLPQGYQTVLSGRGANLSQGQRQMMTIARAMVAQPNMLIIFEATSNVDTRTERLIP